MGVEIKEIDRHFILRTLNLAVKARGMTSPNPMVGAVIVKNNSIIGEGFHERAGLPHAEVVALNRAGKNAKGATLYVSLEPCCHFGKTPPCVHAIIKSGIKRVVAATEDPNPLVSGKGFKYLKDQGIEVVHGIFEIKARRINENFFKYIREGMPFVTVKNAITLDGKMSLRGSANKFYISSNESLKYTHYLRFLNDAIMVSAKTVINDNPSLNVRHGKKRIIEAFKNKKYARIIIDRDLSVSPFSSIFSIPRGPHGRIILFTSSDYNAEKANRKRVLEEKGAIIRDVSYNKVERNAKFLDLSKILRICAEEFEITGIIAEPGPKLFNSLVTAGLCDKLIFNITPYIFGGERGVGLFDGLSLNGKDMLRFKDLDVKKIGNDFFAEYYPEK